MFKWPWAKEPPKVAAESAALLLGIDHLKGEERRAAAQEAFNKLHSEACEYCHGTRIRFHGDKAYGSYQLCVACVDPNRKGYASLDKITARVFYDLQNQSTQAGKETVIHKGLELAVREEQESMRQQEDRHRLERSARAKKLKEQQKTPIVTDAEACSTESGVEHEEI